MKRERHRQIPEAERATKSAEPEISFTVATRLEPGSYRAFCRSSKIYRDSGFKRWVCAVQFDVLDDSLTSALARLTWFLNLGSQEKAHAGRRCNYWGAWVKANCGPPKRKDRMSPSIFHGRYAEVMVADTTKNHRQVSIREEESYSVIRDVLIWLTGGRLPPQTQ